ncbi:branched-chain amino acid ABC transporter permease [Rhodobacter sphaeroides]|jgi:amino acid/amide ABC transporter membrane protein 1, HAAT family (TC 3.A.1.4.-)|uniref:Amino acid/amide ABC transporter membrane protein 1, HAAT family n=2 Tax=Cereibacter sphaeroides TaxID=1063 RepID=Q3IVD6_CERS4|nr:branched-chain amino acid ABC transporter permease [Cereibacter sphaeroides]EKX57473.1 ABC branched chain amino acid transporter, inner membrane subunit [Rhodobacter sp. AKP1]ABA81498.1 amino acid/amide ABC transporter membrane protein 1, HAAT family [Cereibacter sphaeroides 2.4.1]ACM04323.1 ABC branched chain amino acid transporter, inner membrane subunit [Cereibacter sphaeroides KD131]AMJ50051.1 amino acid ABC transporter permease [Cereibacter sphaeroides]ANS36867.1 amino acid ABC transpo
MSSQAVFVLFNGMAQGMAFFLVAAGLTWVFGILKILNLAHGAFFMLGAYIAYSVGGAWPASIWTFLAVALVAAAAVGVLGYLTDVLVLRRLRNVDYHYALIATFGLMLFCEGVAKAIWGTDYFAVMPPPEVDRAIVVGGSYISVYTLFVIGTGLVLYAALEIVMHRTWAGKIMRAVSNDPWMAGTVGINVPLVLMLSVVASFVLAGFAGGVLVPNQALSPHVGASFVLYAFMAVVIGGLGSIRGTFLACILLGIVESANATFMAQYGGIAIYILLAVALVWKPNGLFPAQGTT